MPRHSWNIIYYRASLIFSKKAIKKCPEPESNQWHEDFQSSALPTELSGHELRGKDLNQRPPGYEPDELPDCSTPRYSIKHKCQKETNYLVSLRGVDQIWTGDEGVADLCLTTWLRRHNMTPTGFEPMLPPWKGGVLTTWPRSQTPRVGLEPTTARLTAACSTDWAIEEY